MEGLEDVAKVGVAGSNPVVCKKAPGQGSF